MAQGKHKKLLNKKLRKGDKGYPIATIAFYGADNTKASKVVCAIIASDGAEAEPVKKWFSTSDLRKSEQVFQEILAFIDDNGANSVSMIEQIFGCPHEEGIDYPEGEHCPQCLYWKGRDRYTGELMH